MKCFKRNTPDKSGWLKPTATKKINLDRYDVYDKDKNPKRIYAQTPTKADNGLEIETPCIWYDDKGEIFAMEYMGHGYKTVDGKLVLDEDWQDAREVVNNGNG